MQGIDDYELGDHQKYLEDVPRYYLEKVDFPR